MKTLPRAISLLLLSAMTLTPLTACTSVPPSDEPLTTTSAQADSPSTPSCQHTPSAGGTYCTTCDEILKTDLNKYKDMIYFSCDNEMLTRAYQIAIADSVSNVKKYEGGLLTTLKSVIMAGADYDTPWTRDGSINVWNGFALLDREVSKNTLLSLLKNSGRNYLIDGQYWDAVIWAIGAYEYVLVSNDTAFLKIAQNAIETTLNKFEREEYDSADGLFRGGAVYADGIAAYPDQYANGPNPGIEGWLENPENNAEKAPYGRGLPMKALSTNCVYYEAYVILAQMNELLDKDPSTALAKAEKLKAAINNAFWNEEKGTYDYLAYECDYQEAIGIAFALLFGIADERQSALVLENTCVTEQGIACVWPAFDRYLELDGYGRHSGTIWPHAQGFWARAALEKGYAQGFDFELYALAEKAVQNGQFHEIYHPDTGEVYGGLQEFSQGNIGSWGSCQHQTWSATAYLSCIYYELLGADIQNGSVTFTPYLPVGVNEAVISGMKIGSTTFHIIITRGGNHPTSVSFDTLSKDTVTVFLSVQ